MHPDDLSVHIDYDSTLFDTKRFGEAFYEHLSAQTGLQVEDIQSQSAAFYSNTVPRSFDFDGYILSLGLDPQNTRSRVTELVTENDYLFDDSAPFVQALIAGGYNPRILSFGEERYQRAKIEPNLGRLLGRHAIGMTLGYEIVQVRKGEHLARTLPTVRGVLVDDVPGQLLPSGFTEIHLDRARHLPALLETETGFVVSSLPQALDVIRLL